MKDQDFTEELLTAHEKEIQRLKTELELKALLLVKITRYYDICEDQKELVKAASDQGRLMGRATKGKPGQLLLEEKMRKRVQKDLPKVCHGFIWHRLAYVNIPMSSSSMTC